MNQKPSALFIDDDSLFDRGGVSEYMSLLEDLGYEVEHRACPESGKELLEQRSFDIVFVDYLFHNAPDTQGAELGKYILTRFPMTQVILMSGRLHDGDAMHEYIGIPFHSHFDKGHESDCIEEELKKSLANAKQRFVAKLPVFDEKKVLRFKRELKVLNIACRQNAGSRNVRICTANNYIVQAANIIWDTGKRLSKRDFDDLKIHRQDSTSENEDKKSEIQQRWDQMKSNDENIDHGTTPSCWTQRFQIFEKVGGKEQLIPDATIIWNLIMSSPPGRFKYACARFRNLAKLVDFFKISDHAKGTKS